MTLNRSPEFCLKLTYRNLLKADHVPGDTGGKPILVPRDYMNKLGRGLLGDATYQFQGSKPNGFRQADFFMFSPYRPM